MGSWFTVTVSVVVAAVAAVVLADLEESRDLAKYVVPGTPSTGLSIGDKISGATFGPVVSYAFVAGLALGLVVALITATVVVSMRRTDPVPVAVAADPEQSSAPESPQPFFGNSVEDDRPTRASGGYDTDRYAGSGSTGSYAGSGSYGGSGSYADAGTYADSHPYAAPDRRASEETTTLPAVSAGAAAGSSAGQVPSRSDEPDDRSGEGLSGYDRALGTAPAESTTALPRVGTERPPAVVSPTSGEAEPNQATQAWPAQPEPEATPAPAGPETTSEADSATTAAFPLPARRRGSRSPTRPPRRLTGSHDRVDQGPVGPGHRRRAGRTVPAMTTLRIRLLADLTRCRHPDRRHGSRRRFPGGGTTACSARGSSPAAPSRCRRRVTG